MMVAAFAGCTKSTTTTQNTSEYILEEDGELAGDTDDGAEDSDDTSSAVISTDQQEIKNPLKVDLGGATITVYTTRQDFMNPSASASTKSDQARITMLKKLEKQINCKIDCRNISENQLQTNMFTTITSGKSFSHLILTTAHSSSGIVASQLAEDLKKVATMDLSKDYLNVGGAAEASSYGKGTWYVAEPIGIFSLAQGVFFNKRILGEIGMKDTDLYSLVDKKQWTIAKLRELSNKAVKELDGKSGMTVNDRWGITYIDTQSAFAPSVLEACGAKMLVADANGTIKYNVDSAEVIDAITLAGAMTKDPGSCMLGNSDPDRVNIFSSGHSLFFYAGASNATVLSDMEDDFGFLPFPSNKADGKYHSAVNWNSPVLMIPKGLSAKELKNAGSYIQAYAYMAQTVNDAIVDDYTARYFRDEESGDYFKLAAKGQKLTLAQSVATNDEAILTGTYRVIWNWIQEDTAVSTAIGASKSATVKALEELMKKVK